MPTLGLRHMCRAVPKTRVAAGAVRALEEGLAAAGAIDRRVYEDGTSAR